MKYILSPTAHKRLSSSSPVNGSDIVKQILYALSIVSLFIGCVLGFLALSNNTSFLNGRDATMALFFAVVALYIQGLARDAEPKA